MELLPVNRQQADKALKDLLNAGDYEEARSFIGGEEFIIKVGRAFVDDHVERERPCGWLVKATATQYTLSCNLWEIRELLSDADYYAELGSELGGRGLVASARACAKAIRLQTAPK